jgi:hypothetical protein
MEGNMGTTLESKEIVLIDAGQIVGPESAFAEKRRNLQQEVKPLIEAANKISVDSAESAEQATQAGRVLQAAQKERENYFKYVKGQIDAVKKPVLEAEKEDVGTIKVAKERLGEQLTVYNHKQEQIRIEEERKAREAAEAAAREEALNRAVELDLAGEHDAAEDVLQEPAAMPVVVRSVTPARVAGQVSKVKYTAEVTSLMTLVKAVAEGKVPLHAVQANMSYLNSRASDDKELFAIPGVRSIKSEGTHFRS